MTTPNDVKQYCLQRYRVGGLLALLAALLLPDLTLAAGLNDTGVTQCGNLSQNGQPCPQTNLPSQDAETGRDAQKIAGTLSKAGGGSAGFDFTKLDNTGAPLDAGATSWDCVRDNVTGLIWEGKTNDNGLRDGGWTYTLVPFGSGTCGGFLSDQCNAQAYAAAVNALNPRLCGYADWRVPTIEELHSIVDYSIYTPSIDAAYFPNTRPNYYWSASREAQAAYYVSGVNFADGTGSGNAPGYSGAVRLVRGGE